MPLKLCAALAVGSLAGGFGRYLLSGLAHRLLGADFPYGTMVVNLAGCFAIGWMDVLARERFVLGPEGRMLLMMGFFGAFTTSSTLILETHYLLQGGQFLRAASNVGLSLALGLLMLQAGAAAGRTI